MTMQSMSGGFGRPRAAAWKGYEKTSGVWAPREFPSYLSREG